MNIITNELKNALSALKPALSKKEIVANSNCFVFKQNRIMAFNNELWFTAPIKDCTETFAVESDELIALLDKTKVDEIQLTPNLDDNVLMFRAGKAQAGFNLLDGDFPVDVEILDDLIWEPLPEDFNIAAKFASMSASDDFILPILNCIHITSDGIVEGTNNYRFSQWKLEDKLPIETTLVPYESMLKVLSTHPIEVAQDDDWVHFRNADGVTASCRPMIEKFPDLDSVKAKIIGEQKIDFPDTLNYILDKAEIFTAENKNDKKVTITCKGKYLIVKSKSEKGFFKERVALKEKVDEFDFLINPSFLKDILKRSNTCELNEKFIIFKGDNWIYVAGLKNY